MEFAEFMAQVADAYNHLYDLVRLRTHPLAHLVTPAAEIPQKKKAWLLHDVLLGVIEEFDPGFHAPPDGREKRRYRLLSMRYSEGQASKAVADALAISLRHYYREHDTALEAVAALLWERYGGKPGTAGALLPLPSASQTPTEETPDRQAMLRAEAAHFQDFDHKTRLAEVLPGVIALAQEMARAKGIQLTLTPFDDAPVDPAPQAAGPDALALPVDRTMVRQILLGLLSYLAEQLAAGEIVVRVQTDAQQQVVEVVATGPRVAATPAQARDEQMATLHELAALQAAELKPVAVGAGQLGFALRLPRVQRRTVLLVDDNSDILELYQRYLQQRAYRAVPVQNGGEALRLAIALQPQAIVLDLMLPEQDGWEILQRLTNHPDTHAIPVVICSILRARQLALALGAAAFLEKPVDEAEFLRVLDALTAG